jgi:ribosomal protein S27E
MTTVQNSTGFMIACPNCKEHTIPCSHADGLLSDWCDSCNKSIFDTNLIDADWAAQQMEDNREL